MPKLSALVFHTLDSVKDDGQLLFGCGTEGLVYQLESSTGDDSTTINAEWVTPWLDMDAPHLVKVFRHLHLTIERIGGPLYVEWSVDDGKASGDMQVNFPTKYRWGGKSRWNATTGLTQGGMFWVRSDSIGRVRMMLDLPQACMGERVQFTFTETSAAEGFEVVDATVLWRPRFGPHATGGV